MDWSSLTKSPVWARYGDEIVHGLLNLGGAAIILIVGLWFAGAAARFTRRNASKARHIEPTLVVFFGSVVRYAIIAFVIVAVLQRFGVQTTSVVAVLGAATLAIGLALQGALSNVAAGVLLILYRPYRIGDYVELMNGKAGTVRDVNIFTTELSTLDNVKVVVPNGQIFNSAIMNYSTSEIRRADVEFHMAYGADLETAIGAVTALLKADPRVKDIPAPWVKITRYTDAAVILQARAWCKNADVLALRHDLLTEIYTKLRSAGIAFK